MVPDRHLRTRPTRRLGFYPDDISLFRLDEQLYSLDVAEDVLYRAPDQVEPQLEDPAAVWCGGKHRELEDEGKRRLLMTPHGLRGVGDLLAEGGRILAPLTRPATGAITPPAGEHPTVGVLELGAGGEERMGIGDVGFQGKAEEQSCVMQFHVRVPHFSKRCRSC